MGDNLAGVIERPDDGVLDGGSTVPFGRKNHDHPDLQERQKPTPMQTSFHLDILSEMFPSCTPDVVNRAYEESAGDVVAATEALTNEVKVQSRNQASSPSLSSPSSFAIQVLSDMFPNMDIDVLKRNLKEHNGDINKTSDAILEYQTVMSLQEQLRLEDEEEKQTRKKSSDTMENNVRTLTELSGLKEEEARVYLHRNSANVCFALLDIIFHYSEEQNKATGFTERTKIRDSVQALPLSRVQGTSGAPFAPPKRAPGYSLTPKEKPFWDSERLSSSSSSSSSSPSTISTAATSSNNYGGYVFRESNPEVAELATIVYDDKQLVELSWNFYQCALEFFKGDVAKAISSAIYVVENGGAKRTYREKTRVLDFSHLFAGISRPEDHHSRHQDITPVVTAKEPQGAVVINKENHLEDKLDEYQIRLQRTALRNAVEHNKLDLHSFSVRNARATAEKALKQWWSDELKYREEIGVVTSSRTARTPPLIIITGRGIHSGGGIPKIRRSINLLLDLNGYVYEEETSWFTVVGKKMSS